MAVKLNLLPPELSVSGGLAKILKTTRMLGVIFLAGFLIFALGTGAFFLVSSLQLKNLTQNIDQLKTQIKAQAVSEQQIVLLKDRIKGIKSARNSSSALKELADFDPFLTSLTSDSSVNELQIAPQKIEATILFRSSADLTAFLQSLKSSTAFSLGTVNSFSFNPATGYLVTFRLTGK